MSAGAFALVLHGHLPWVLHHGRWPHGEDWLFEAASETWLPLLDVLDRCAAEGIRPAWTLGLTPVLLEQLGHTRFKTGFRGFLAEQVARAVRDAAEFRGREDLHLGHLADEHARRYRAQLELLDRIDDDIVGALAEHAGAGRIELMSSNATHAYHPLVLHDATARGQVRAGLATSERHLGHRPAGVWLPECAYRPGGPWTPPAVHGDQRHRSGVGRVFSDEGVRFFVVDTHLLQGSTAVAVVNGDRTDPVDSGQPDWDVTRGWRSELEPHRIAEDGVALPLTVLARCPDVSEQVWSGAVGYPGDGRYLEFHKRHGQRGLRYWKVTGEDVDLGAKDTYHPDDVRSAVHSHAQHFATTIHERLQMHRSRTGRWGVVCAPFDAELFGHWWFEGPEFLFELAQAVHHDPEVEAMTCSQALDACPADKVVALPEGSWGAGGDHRVWFNEELRVYWEVAYRAEDRFLDLLHRAPWRSNPEVREELVAAGRQLLFLMASDWPFVVHTRGAVDYGLRRIFGHAGRFDALCNGLEDRLADADVPRDEVVAAVDRFAALVDDAFPDLDLAWFS